MKVRAKLGLELASEAAPAAMRTGRGICALICFWALSNGAQEPTFRAGVTVVRVDAQVLEGGRSVPGLSAGDFVVRDEGAPQPIAYFAHESDPLDLLLLLDVSGSMRRHLEEMARAARRAAGRLRPGDRAGIMFFSRRTELALALTADRDALEQAFERTRRPPDLGSGTAINASILEAARYVSDHASRGRRAIVILTDNEGLNYQTPDEEVVRALWGADCVLNAIVTKRAARPKPAPVGWTLNPDFTPADVFRLAEETGGQVVRADDAGQALVAMMEHLRTRYSLHYRAPEVAPGSFRRIELDLTAEARRRHPRAVILARRGYYAAP